MAPTNLFLKHITTWATDNPELVIILALVGLSYFQVCMEKDPTSTITGIFGFLTGSAKKIADEKDI